ncbi:putative transposase [Escherichia coli P0301867.5]|nr:putative transposase [Escherichia coli P0301867.5]
MLPSETMIWQPEFTDKTLSRKPGAVQLIPYTEKNQIHICICHNYSSPI